MKKRSSQSRVAAFFVLRNFAHGFFLITKHNTMKRTIQKLILLFAMLMSGMVMEAAPVDMSTARKVGFTFMNADSKVPLRSIDDLQLVTTYNIKRGDTAFYIFNTQKASSSFQLTIAQFPF